MPKPTIGLDCTYKYEEAILMQEEVLEPSLIDSADTAPAQGKPVAQPLFYNSPYIYVLCIYVTGILWKPHV